MLLTVAHRLPLSPFISILPRRPAFPISARSPLDPLSLFFPFSNRFDRNVNGWHWEDKNCIEFARRRLGELLAGVEIPLDPLAGTASFKGLKTLSGDCHLHKRKGNKVRNSLS
jgi:hypothetical protein